MVGDGGQAGAGGPFCKAFSKEVVGKRFQNRTFFVKSLEMALFTPDWPSVKW